MGCFDCYRFMKSVLQHSGKALECLAEFLWTQCLTGWQREKKTYLYLPKEILRLGWQNVFLSHFYDCAQFAILCNHLDGVGFLGVNGRANIF